MRKALNLHPSKCQAPNGGWTGKAGGWTGKAGGWTGKAGGWTGKAGGWTGKAGGRKVENQMENCLSWF